jgi:IMP dehydrogenase/GMP reductase
MSKLFDLDDISLIPVIQSDVNSRDDINIHDNSFMMLPIITAPMDTVIDESNEHYFSVHSIITCLPRGIKSKYGFTSMSLEEIVLASIYNQLDPEGQYLIDIANGHMSKLTKVVKMLKNKHPKMTLMVGNVANPETYAILSDAGADLIRVSIGSGNACLTAEHLGVYYPLASLVNDCYKKSLELNNPAKIVADGGMKKYSDVIKCLALGADYVMIGSIFNKALESCGQNYILRGKIPVSLNMAHKLYNLGIPVYKKFRGMSTKEVQRKWGKSKLRSSEGVVKVQRVEYELKDWVSNFRDYLKSSMSYCGAKNLDEFIGEVRIEMITDKAFKRFNK